MIQEKVHKELTFFEQKFIIGVSGGVDSMSLLNIVINFRPHLIVVCHINYNLRQQSINERNLIEKFCHSNNIKYYILEVENKLKSNIQDQARTIRLNFFKKISKKYGIKNILLGHNLEDHLETYFLQKERNIITPFFGIKKSSNIRNLLIIRPMLNIPKKKIYKYAKFYKVPFLEDDSNQKKIYKRNIIRIEKISKMSLFKKKLLTVKIIFQNWKNKKLFKKIAIIKKEIVNGNKFHKSLFDIKKEKYIFIILFHFLKEFDYPIKRINKKIIKEIISFHNKSINNKVTLKMCGDFYLQKNKNWYSLLKGK